MRRGLTVLLLAMPLLARAAPLVSIDPLTATGAWQVGGNRINYQLGRSAVTVSGEQPRPGFATSLKLTYDFSDARRHWLSYYHTGGPIVGDCRGLRFELYGDASGARLRLALEDGRGRWFQHEAARVDWTGWRTIAVPLEPAAWRPLLRLGEQPLPIAMPVNLREIALLRGGPEQPSGEVWISDLRGEISREGGRGVAVELATGRPGNLFAAGEPVVIRATFRGRAGQRCRVAGTVFDYLDRERPIDAVDVQLSDAGEATRSLACPADGQGSYRLQLDIEGQVWWQRFAVLADQPPRPPTDDSAFGVWGNIASVPQRDQALAAKLNAASGCGWTRIGMDWAQLNPAEGVWAWDGAARADGVMGLALSGAGSSLEVPDDSRFDLPGGLTIAFWSKLEGGNGNWQWPIFHEGAGGQQDRAWGVYFHRDTGELFFSAGFASQPEVGHVDLGSGFQAWDGRWHHCAVSYDPAAGQVGFYVDGKLVRTVAQAAGKLRAARTPVRVASSYAGLLDDVRVYDHALRADDIAALAARQSPDLEGLVAGWSFDEASGPFRDSSGHGFDLAPAEPWCIQQAREARRQGLRVLGILGFPPAWASTAATGDPRPAQHEPRAAAWTAYVEETVRHYAGLIDHWELWNEPNITVFWEPEPDPETFAKVAIAGYQAAKRGNPEAVVMTPGLAGPHGHGDRMAFLDTILAAGVQDATDAVSIHPYRQATPEESDLLGELRHIHDGSGGKPIWYTEMCWTNQIPGGSTEGRTAQMLVRCFALSLGSRMVDRIIWFRFHDPGLDRFYTEHNYGLCWHDLTPKPAWFAFRTCARLLDHAVPAGDWQLGDGGLGRLFQTPSGPVAVVWSPVGSTPAAVQVGAEEITVTDPMGNARTVATPGGVWLGQLEETALFLTGLGAGSAPAARPVAATLPRLMAGVGSQVTIGVANPTAQAVRTTLTILVDPGLRLATPAVSELALAARERRDVVVELAAAEPGRYTMTIALDLHGARLRQSVPIEVHTAAADAGPVGWWKLDEGQGTALADSSGHGLTGTVDRPRWVAGRFGQALEFGAGGIATVPGTPLLDRPDEVTVAFWIKPLADTGTWQFPVTRFYNENVVRNYGVYLAPGELQPAFSTSPHGDSLPHRDVRAGTGLTIGQWHHVAARYSVFDGVCRVWIDGRPAATQTLGGLMKLVADQPLRLGVGTQAVLDDVRLWPRVLSDDEVARLAE